jgi:MFS family permease
VLIDAAVQANQVATQKILFSGNIELRGRINAIYMASVFAGGALGSFLGAFVYHQWGWAAAALAGALLGAIVLTLFMTEPRVEKSENNPHLATS